MNPNAVNGISPGDVLIISQGAASQMLSFDYTVKQHDTFFSLSRKFNISADSIRLLNDGLPEGLKAGQVLKLMATEDVIKREGISGAVQNASDSTHQRDIEPHVVILNKDTIQLYTDFKTGRKDEYKVGLIMPFYYEKNEKYIEDGAEINRTTLYEPTRQATDFYQGVHLALDSLRAAGLNASLKVYDSARDTAKLRSICEGADFKELDLIIGPTEYVELVARYAKSYQIPMVCPVAYSNRILLDNPFVFKMIGSSSVLADRTSQFIVKHYPDDEITIIDGKGKGDVGIVRAYKKYLNRYRFKQTEHKDSVRVLQMDYFSMKTIEPLLSKSKKNIIVIPSNDFAYVSVALSNLNKYLARYNHKDVDVVVFGNEEWLRMEDIDVTYKLRSQVHVPSPTLIDYDTLSTRVMVQSFRHRFHTDPDKYAMMGFDIAYFWMAGYLQFGLDFNGMVTKMDMDLVHTGFRFMRLNDASGFLNRNVYILKYENYKLVPQEP